MRYSSLYLTSFLNDQMLTPGPCIPIAAPSRTDFPCFDAPSPMTPFKSDQWSLGLPVHSCSDSCPAILNCSLWLLSPSQMQNQGTGRPRRRRGGIARPQVGWWLADGWQKMGIRRMREMTVRVGPSSWDIKFIYSRNSDACNVKNTHLDKPGDYCA